MSSTRVPAPKIRVAPPRSTAATPIVAMMTAITERPIIGRKTRSSPKQSTTMPMTAISAASQNETTVAAAAAIKPPNMTNSPCAKLNASVAL